jgi:hypothetical protein
MSSARGNTPKVLVTPEPETPPTERWYHKYQRLNSALFTKENSGRSLGLAPPFRHVYKGGGISDISASYIHSSFYQLLGYTEHPPFFAPYPSVAIMFETEAGEKTWWHYGAY